jgi:branched-chain amino acid transport system substrate-binding protein
VSRKLLALAAVAALAAGVAGCGGSHHPSGAGSTTGTGTATTPSAPPQLQVVASLPTTGPNAALGQAVDRGIQLALAAAGRRAGGYQIDYDANDDATGNRDFSPSLEAKTARIAATDPRTILYIGDLASGASRVSIPILTAAGIPQLIPGSPATNLTATPSSATQGGHEPEWTFLRLVPSNLAQAVAELEFLHSQPNCRILALPQGRDLDSENLAHLIKQHSRQYGLTVVGDDPVDPTKRGKFQAYLAKLTDQHANCAIYAGTLAEGAVAVAEGLHSALDPGARIIGSSNVCTSAWTKPALRRVPWSLLYCTAPGPALSATPAGRAFAISYKKAYGVAPDPAAAYGYEAMKLGLDAINADERRGDDRVAVLATLAHRPATDSPVGDFYFKDDGNTSSPTYTVYRVRPGGSLASVSTAPGSG